MSTENERAVMDESTLTEHDRSAEIVQLSVEGEEFEPTLDEDPEPSTTGESVTAVAEEPFVDVLPKHTPGRRQKGDGSGLSGVARAAIFVLSLDEQAASRMLRCLTDEEMSRVTAEIANLGVIDKETVLDVVTEFSELEHASGIAHEGGFDSAARILRQSFSDTKSADLLRLLAKRDQQQRFSFASSVDVDSLAASLQEERNQTVALVLAHLNSGTAAAVLRRLNPERTKDVLHRIARLDGANSDAIVLVEETLRKHLETARFSAMTGGGGAEAVAKIMRATDDHGAIEFLDELRTKQPSLADKVSRHFFAFEDLARLDDSHLRTGLKKVDLRDLALALRNTGRDVRKKISRNLSRRAAESLRSATRELGPVRLSEVEASRARVLEELLGLDQDGSLSILAEGRGTE